MNLRRFLARLLGFLLQPFFAANQFVIEQLKTYWASGTLSLGILAQMVLLCLGLGLAALVVAIAGRIAWLSQQTTLSPCPSAGAAGRLGCLAS